MVGRQSESRSNIGSKSPSRGGFRGDVARLPYEGSPGIITLYTPGVSPPSWEPRGFSPGVSHDERPMPGLPGIGHAGFSRHAHSAALKKDRALALSFGANTAPVKVRNLLGSGPVRCFLSGSANPRALALEDWRARKRTEALRRAACRPLTSRPPSLARALARARQGGSCRGMGPAIGMVELEGDLEP